MKSAENNIEIEKTDTGVKIIIYPKYNAQKHGLMLVWLALWTICGIAVFTQLFAPYDSKTKLFFILYLLFWLYFEYKVIYTHRWRKKGREVIEIKNGKLSLIKEINGRGVEQVFDIQDIDGIEQFQEKENSMSQLFGNAYWMISGYRLALKTAGKLVPFAAEITEKEQKKIVFELKNRLK